MRRLRFLGALAAVALFAGACGGDTGTSGGTAAKDTNPIRIAIIPALTGNFASIGAEIKAGAELAIAKVNEAGGIDGRKVELVVLETDGQPASTLQRVARALTSEKAPFIAGIISSAESLAVLDRVKAGDGLLLNNTSTADEIVAACNERVFFTVPPNTSITNAIVTQVKNMEAQSFSVIVPDYATGRESASLFATAAKAAGKKVNPPIFVPLGTTEFGPQIARLQKEGADGLYAAVQAGSAVAFTKQASQFGYLKNLKTVVGNNYAIELTFKPQGQDIVGTIGNFSYYAPEIKTPANEQFVAAYKAKNGAQPTFVAANMYAGLEALFAGVKEAGSVKPADVAKAMRSMTFESILGPNQKFRQGDQLLERAEFVGEVVSEGGTLAWKTLEHPTFADTAPKNTCK